MKTVYLTLFMILVVAALLATGCSIKNPNDTFKLAVEGDFEKAIMDSLTSQARGLDTTLFVGHHMVGASASDDADAVAVISGGLRLVATAYQIVRAVYYNGETGRLGALFNTTMSNAGANPVDVTIYLSTESGLGNNIVNSPELRIMGFTIPANGSFDTFLNSEIVGYVDFQDLTLVQSATRNGIPVYVYIYVSGSPVVNVTISELLVSLPSSYEFDENVAPGDVSSYTLENLYSIGVSGMFGVAPSTGFDVIDSVVVSISCKSGTGSDTSVVGVVEVGRINIVNPEPQQGALFEFELDTVSNSMITTNGNAILSQRFREMFPPTSLGSYFRVNVVAYPVTDDMITYRISNLSVIANARVNRN